MKKLYEKLLAGKGLAIIIGSLVVFAAACFLIISFNQFGGSSDTYKVGQLATKTIRANKTIEDDSVTKDKIKLARDAVTPEYVYQADVATAMDKRINYLFAGVAKVSADQEFVDVGGDDLNLKVAKLKDTFKDLSVEDIAFFKQFSGVFYTNLFQSTDLSTVQSSVLNVVDSALKQNVRKDNVNEIRDDALNSMNNDLVAIDEQIARALVSECVVVNDVLDEKKTEDARDKAEAGVTPVKINQGEIIISEGVQIDASAYHKLELLGMTKTQKSPAMIVAMLICVILQSSILYYFTFRASTRKIMVRTLSLYMLLMIINLGLMKFLGMFQSEHSPYLALIFPAAASPIIMFVFATRRSGIVMGVFQAIFTLFIFSDYVGDIIILTIIMTYLFNGLFGAVLRRQKKLREQLHPVAIWLVVYPTVFSVILVLYQGLNPIGEKALTEIGCTVIGCILSLLLSISLHPYIELWLDDDSEIALNRLSDPNHPLLKELLEKAPGTYNHSMVLANIASDAAAAIGARTLLTRIGAYYHDIGKIKNPNFFVENLPGDVQNPHDFLMPDISKQIIFDHVSDGVQILREHHLPESVIDICQQHHGTTLVKYFYIKAREENPDVLEEDYRYPGPIPQSKEAAIINIADSAEAAVKAMTEPTMDAIEALVRSIISERLQTRQFEDSGLTIRDLGVIEHSLIGALKSSFHTRIKYPEDK
jgi:putative nucleotidyltransferase with HDIG domain